jgi:serine/threonine-protein kinase
VEPGYVLGRYELLIPIAAGGMAQVWAARLRGARQFQKIVAVKTMLPKLSEDEQFEQMFLDEASLASRIRHPNVVEILDLGEHSGVLYLIMEWIEGVPLNQLMKTAKANGGVPAPVATRIALQACAGLHAAHELTDDKGALVGLVHRDVSPQNLLVTYDGVTKVVDFGVAKATALGGGATVAGQIKGKVGYMAPEQVRGEPLDRRVDVFAMGIVLYALTTGKHPFRRESEAATMYNICAPQPVTPPSKIIAGYPPELEPIVLRALAKDRDERYASCDEMLRALDALPSHLRASSDADVAQFVRQLFSDRREASRKQLEEAIDRANRAQPLPRAAGPAHESISAITAAQGRASVITMQHTGELSGIPNVPSARNRWLGIAGLAALALSGGVLFQAFASRGAAPEGGAALEDEVQVIEAPSVPLPATPAQTGDATPELTAQAATPEPQPAPTEPAPKDSASSAGKKSSAPTKPAPSPATPSTGATGTSPQKTDKPAPTQKSWKFDAGF